MVCSAASRFLSARAPKDQVGLVEHPTAPVLLQGLEWVRVASVVQCIRHASIPRVRLDRVPECRADRALELLVLASAQRLAWRLRPALQIARRADMRSAVAETTATKSRRKVQ